MKNLIVICLLVLCITGCNGQDKNMKETPLVSIIKLKSAEAVLNFEEAKKYIDLDKVFEENPDVKDIEKEWRETITVLHNLGKDKKFTNQFKYFNYKIIEVVEESTAKVIFTDVNDDFQIKETIYSLEKKEENWIVVGIRHIN